MANLSFQYRRQRFYRFSAQFDHSLETRTPFIFFPSFLDRVPLDDRLVTRLRLFVKFVPVWEDKRKLCVFTRGLKQETTFSSKKWIMICLCANNTENTAFVRKLRFKALAINCPNNCPKCHFSFHNNGQGTDQGSGSSGSRISTMYSICSFVKGSSCQNSKRGAKIKHRNRNKNAYSNIRRGLSSSFVRCWWWDGHMKVKTWCRNKGSDIWPVMWG